MGVLGSLIAGWALAFTTRARMENRIERRTDRSWFRGEAANLYLDALARRHHLRAAVLADDQGMPIAATGPKMAEGPLSAYGAFRARQRPSKEGEPREGPRSVSFCLGEHAVSLTVLGHSEIPWSEVTTDLARILELRG
jgi:hypothetical protein